MNWFNKFSQRVAQATGHPFAFGAALSVIALWLISGPVFRFSDTWQLVINTGTTIITFLMVFLIQHSQNRDSAATQLKLDEVIRALRSADNALLDLEAESDQQLQLRKAAYEQLAHQANEALAQRTSRVKR